MRVYDARTNSTSCLAKLEGHAEGDMLNCLRTVDVSDGEVLVVSGCDDNKVKVFRHNVM